MIPQTILNAWRQILGDEQVVTADFQRYAAQTATFETTQQIPAILYPASTVQVQECLKVANAFAIPIYPVSRGKNFGYGSRVPAQDQTVLMDLSRMNRILACDDKLCFVTLEPGVTYHQLVAYLTENKIRLLPNFNNSTWNSSPLGNAMDRGIGIFADTWDQVIALEVVLPTGECIRTGHGAFPNSRTASLDRWGTGPALEGLFSQSNLGIVTQITFAMQPEIDLHPFLIKIEDEALLPVMIDGLQALIVQKLPQFRFTVWNDYRVLASKQQYPWREAGDQTPLPDDVFTALKAQWGIGAWHFQGSLMAYSNAQIAWEKEILTDAVTSLGGQIEFAALSEMFASNSSRLQPAYWRKKRAPVRYNLDAEACGVIWHMLSLPFRGEDVKHLSDLMCETLLQYGLEPCIICIPASLRELHMSCMILFDREVADADENALACLETLIRRTTEAGYAPHRLSIHAMTHENLLPRDPAYQACLDRLKTLFDPNHILAPGRYGMY